MEGKNTITDWILILYTWYLVLECISAVTVVVWVQIT